MSQGTEKALNTNKNPTSGKVETPTVGEDYKFFNTSWQALVKASTMFSGELVSLIKSLFITISVSVYNSFLVYW